MSVFESEVALSRGHLHSDKLHVRASLSITVNNLWPGCCTATTFIRGDLSKIMWRPFSAEAIKENGIH